MGRTLDSLEMVIKALGVMSLPTLTTQAYLHLPTKRVKSRSDHASLL